MLFRIGTKFFDRNSVAVTRSSVARTSRAGNPISRVWTFTVTVYFASAVTDPYARQVDFVAQETVLHNILDVPGQEYALHADNLVPAMVLSPINAISKPKCYEIGNMVEGRGEYSGQRTITFKVSAEYPIGNRADLILNFEERLAFQGDGGPIFEDFGSDSGASIRQIIRPNSPCFAYQIGTATGFLAYPKYGGPRGAPASLWPADWKTNLSTYEELPPKVSGDTLTDWTIAWNYTHSRWGTPFVGAPHVWK